MVVLHLKVTVKHSTIYTLTNIFKKSLKIPNM